MFESLHLTIIMSGAFLLLICSVIWSCLFAVAYLTVQVVRGEI